MTDSFDSSVDSNGALDSARERVFALPSGARVEWRRPRIPFFAHYAVLAWPRDSGPASDADVDAMWSLAHALARAEGARLFADPQCFSVLYNGGRTRRKPWPHFHVIPARTPGEKRRSLLLLSCKRWLRKLPFPPRLEATSRVA